MDITVQKLIGELPPYKDEWKTIHNNQSVPDIIDEVIEAHKRYAPFYDSIALYFDADSLQQIADNIYDFLKKNIRYCEEKQEDQTTALPTGILTRLQGDCKHYGGFAAGILDGLNRDGHKIKWCYRFASYRPFDKIPHHVFVVVNPGENEIWIDPTPGADSMEPVWFIDKKIKTQTMPLRTNIAGIGDTASSYEVADNGDLIYSRPYWQLLGAEGVRGRDGNHGTNPYFTGPFLGLQHYAEDPYSIEGTDWNITSDDLQTKSGIDWDPDFVKWVYTNSLKFWNFYEPHGVTAGYRPAVPLPSWYPELILTADNRLTFDRDYKVDDFENDEIQALTAWAQDQINEYDEHPFPLKTRDVKLFSQNYTGMPGNVNANLLHEHRGAGFVSDILKSLEHFVNKVKTGVFKVIGFIPRNAFLGLVGINAFNMAGNMWDKIQQGDWDKMARKWEQLGGIADKLRGTIEDGHTKKAILGSFDEDYIGEAATISALLASAAPIIAAMLAFIKDKDGKIHDVLKATKDFFAAKYPEVDFSEFGFLDKTTGKEIQWTVDDKDNENKGAVNNGSVIPTTTSNPINSLMTWVKANPMIAAAGGGLAFYFITKKKSRVNGAGNLLLPVAIAAGIYFFAKGSGSSSISVENMRNELIAESPQDKAWATIILKMTNDEIANTYDFIFNYAKKNIQVPKDSALYHAIMAISGKYNIFT